MTEIRASKTMVYALIIPLLINNEVMATKTAASKTTTNHDEIMKWAEQRGGKPALVKQTEGEDEENAGVLRIKFRNTRNSKLEDTDWNTFFKTFDDKNLSFLFQEKTKEGKESRFFKIIKNKS
jgi:hypothetical protein